MRSWNAVPPPARTPFQDLPAAAGAGVARKLERIERTSARVATLNKLARALGTRTSALFGTSGQPVARRESDEDLAVSTAEAIEPSFSRAGEVTT